VFASYRFGQGSAQPQLVTASLANGQGAACWVAVTPNGRTAYTANAAGSSISSYGVAHDGTLTLLAAQAGFNGPAAGALDMAVSPDGRLLHVLANRSPHIVSYAIGGNGTLVPLGQTGGFAAGAAGLVAV
jgi:6-phosphogluconolactonase (cycloisomerase 2 family)